MSSNYTPTPQETEVLSLMTDSDKPSAQLFRVPLERLFDMVHYVREQLRQSQTPQFTPSDRTWDTVSTLVGVHLEDEGPSTALVITPGPNDVAEVDEIGVTTSVGDLSGVMGTSVADAAKKGDEIVVVGAGTFNTAWSDDAGVTWSGRDIAGATPGALAVSATHFLTLDPGSANVYRTPDISTTAWTTTVVPGAPSLSGFIAATSLRVLVNAGNSLFVSFNNGSSFSSLSNDLPGGGGTYALRAFGDTFYIVHHITATETFTLYSSTDGVTWTEVSAVTTPDSPSNPAFAFQVCKQTGLMLLQVELQGGTETRRLEYVSSDLGKLWSQAAVVREAVTDEAVVAGRVFVSAGSGSGLILQSQRYL